MTSKTPSQATAIALIQSDISHIKGDMTEVKELIENKYVTKTEFEPIKKVVYGLVALILTGVGAAVLALVVSKP